MQKFQRLGQVSAGRIQRGRTWTMDAPEALHRGIKALKIVFRKVYQTMEKRKRPHIGSIHVPSYMDDRQEVQDFSMYLSPQSPYGQNII